MATKKTRKTAAQPMPADSATGPVATTTSIALKSFFDGGGEQTPNA